MSKGCTGLDDVLYMSMEEMASVASMYLDLDNPESGDETLRDNATAILDEWTYGDPEDCRVLLTDHLNDVLHSVTEDILYIRLDGVSFVEGIHSLCHR